MKRIKNKNKKGFKRKKNLNRNKNKYCKFTAEGVEQIDYKDIDTLKKYITETSLKLEKLFQVELRELRIIIKNNWL